MKNIIMANATNLRNPLVIEPNKPLRNFSNAFMTFLRRSELKTLLLRRLQQLCYCFLFRDEFFVPQRKTLQRLVLRRVFQGSEGFFLMLQVRSGMKFKRFFLCASLVFSEQKRAQRAVDAHAAALANLELASNRVKLFKHFFVDSNEFRIHMNHLVVAARAASRQLK
jgi:hypothetical protein